MGHFIITIIAMALMSVLSLLIFDNVKMTPERQDEIAATKVFTTGFNEISQVARQHYAKQGEFPADEGEIFPAKLLRPASPFAAGGWTYSRTETSAYICVSGPARLGHLMSATDLASRYPVGAYFVSSFCGATSGELIEPGDSTTQIAVTLWMKPF